MRNARRLITACLLPALIIGALAAALLVGGCAANSDPNASLDNISAIADIAEVSVTLFTDPGPEQTRLLAEIDKARQLSDLPALRRIIAQFRGTPATQPTK